MRRDDLHTRQVETLRAWTSFVEHGDRAEALVRPEILSSWTRSVAAIPTDVPAAPMADESETASMWADSPLQAAVAGVEAELRRTAEDGDLVLAITDAETRILWTYGGRVMRRKAETVNFAPGRPLGRPVRRHQRPRPGQPDGVAVDGLLRRALRPDRAQLGVLGRAGLRPGTPVARSASSTSPRPGSAPTRSAWPPPG